MYVSCVYPAISKGPKQLPNCLKIAETSVALNILKGVICDVSAYTVNVSLSVAQQESGTRKAMFWAVTVDSKQLSSQYNSNRTIAV